MTIKEIEKSYGVCGLVCALCSYNANCEGCQCKEDNCDVKACCQSKGLDYCFLCEDWPCDKDMHKGLRVRAFNSVAKNEGLHTLAEYLYKNLNRGIYYHKPDGLTGDYDKCKTEQDVIELLKTGKPDPYEKCPEYESKNFLLRLISMDDAEDLLECYNDTEAQKFFNSDNCTSDFLYSTIDEMRECIKGWLDAYKNRGFIRYSIIDKLAHKAIGTIEIFGGKRGGRRTERGVLRIDIRHEYEREEALIELLIIADLFFYDFNVEKFITKAIPEAVRRIDALTNNGYTPYPTKYEHYYIKRSPQNGA
jgi:RimJ/RimL family protein N-acetyltransferase